MAPEQATEKVVNEQTDLYNFGATMYRMFTGHYANLGMPDLGTAALGRRGKPKPPIKLVPDIPGTLNETIMACLEHNPDRRPAGVFEIKHQLVAVAKYTGIEARRSEGKRGRKRRLMRNWLDRWPSQQRAGRAFPLPLPL